MAKIGVSCDIEKYEVKEYPRHIYGKEIESKAWFYILVLPKLSYSLKEKRQELLVFDMKTIASIVIQLTVGVQRIHD
jgi:hypothetical protein